MWEKAYILTLYTAEVPTPESSQHRRYVFSGNIIAITNSLIPRLYEDSRGISADWNLWIWFNIHQKISKETVLYVKQTYMELKITSMPPFSKVRSGILDYMIKTESK